MSQFNYGVRYIRGLSLLVRLLFAGIELLIILRAFFVFLQASASAPFAQWVNELSNPFLRPFVGIFPSVTIGKGFIVEFYALFALIVYAFIGYVLGEIILIYGNHLSNRKSREEKVLS